MDFEIRVTELGRTIGWVCMHNGGFCRNPVTRYEPYGSYVPATMAELDEACQRGELLKEYGSYVALGGILRNFVPNIIVP